jgi:rhodanese-related sulfurtransferase
MMKLIDSLRMLMAIGVFILISACQSAPTQITNSPTLDIGKVVKVDNGTYKDISVTELQTQMKNKDFTLVNVHIPFEGNLPETDSSIPYDTIGQNLARLPGDKNSKIILYCRSGRMSTMAATELAKLGYTNIWNLQGGMVAWEQAGLKVEK